MKGLSPEEHRDLILSVGTHKSKRRLEPVEVAKLIQKSLNAGNIVEVISNEIDLSKRVIQKFTSLLSLPPEIHLVIGWGSDPSTVSFTAGAEIARLKTAQEQKFLTTAIIENQLNIPEVKQVVQIRQRSERSIEESVKAVLNQRPVIERRHLVIGKLLSKQLEQYLQKVDQQERNALLNHALQKQGLGTPAFGSKLNTEYFLVVCDEPYYKALLTLPGGFEETITQQLLETRNEE